MNRPSARARSLLVALGGLALLSAGAWLGTDALAQKADRPPAKGKMATSAKAPKALDQEEQQKVLAALMERSAAKRSLTARGQRVQDAPPFKTTTRIEHLEFHPCSDCHDAEVTNRKVRELADEHTDLEFRHGGGRFWCYDVCHNANNMDELVSYRGQAISFDESYKLCGQCHFERQKDWYFGGHGKRAGTFANPRDAPVNYAEFDWSDREAIGTWQGERVRHICTDCHNAHSPAIAEFEPSPPPKVRSGLTRKDRGSHAPGPVWDELAHKQNAQKKSEQKSEQNGHGGSQ